MEPREAQDGSPSAEESIAFLSLDGNLFKPHGSAVTLASKQMNQQAFTKRLLIHLLHYKANPKLIVHKCL